jgi:ABC-2 type transport system ATP-binding protein
MVDDGSAVTELEWSLVDAVKAYKGNRALDGVSITLSPGTTVLLGRNGAGKSTLFRNLAGVERLTSGAVMLNSIPLRTTTQWRDAYRGLGWLPQSFMVPSRMRVEEVATYAGWLKELREPDLGHAAREALESVDLWARRRDRVGALSGGMVRRLGFAAAAVGAPALLLLDEPSAGLDPAQRDALHRHVRNLPPTTITVWSTHLLEDVSAFDCRVVVLDRGRVAFEGDRQSLEELGQGSDALGRLKSGFLNVIGQDSAVGR